MKTNKSIMLLSLLGLLVTGCGKTSETTPDTTTPDTTPSESISTEPVVKTLDYYLAGNINLGNEANRKFAYDAQTKTYSLEGISLKRGDAFVISGTENAAAISFDSLTEKDGFEAGNGNYIAVRNEGIYTIKIIDGALTLTKTGSNYQSVRLVYEDGTESLDFVLQDDFTFALKDAALRFRQKFYIDMDGEKLSFDSLAFNPAYYKAFRFLDNDIEAIKKGKFNLTIDFSLSQPLVITSDAILEENAAPEDGDAYKKFIKKLNGQFAASGSKYTVDSTITSGGTVTKKIVNETLNENQHYIETKEYTYSEDQDAEGAIKEETAKDNALITKSEAVLNATNYYEITKYENDNTKKPHATGAMIQDKAEEDTEKADDSESTLVNIFERKTLTTEAAKEKVISFQSEYKNIDTMLSSLLAHTHIVGNSSYTDDQIKDNLKITSEYVGDVGDTMKIEFSNVEVAASAYGTSYYATDVLSLLIDEEGNIESGEYTVKSYQGSKIVDTTTKLPVENIEDYLTKTSVYKFTAEYGDRSAVSAFQMPIEENIASEVESAQESYELSSKVSALGIKDFGVTAVEPLAPIDLENYKIMTYDSKYFNKNYDGSLTGKGVLGNTTITIGNEYNLVTYDVKVTLTYAPYTSSSQLGDLKIDGKTFSTVYVGQTYDVTLTPNAGYDPSDIKIASSSDAVTLSDFNSDEDKRSTGTITFKMKVNKAETGVKITTSSISTPTIKNELTLTITEPWTASKAAAVYDSGNTYNKIKYIKLNADKTGTIGYGTSTYEFSSESEYDFTYDITATGLVTLKSSEHITALQIEMTTGEQHLAASTGYTYTYHKKIVLNKITIDGKDYSPSGSYYGTYTERLAILSGNFTMKDEADKEYTYVKTEMKSGVYEGTIFFTDGTTTSKFTIKAPSSTYAGYGIGATNYYADINNTSDYTYSGSYTYTEGVYTVTFGSKVFTITINA